MLKLIRLLVNINPKFLFFLIIATIFLLIVEMLGLMSLSYFIDYLINKETNIINLDKYFEKFNITKSLFTISVLVVASGFIRNFYMGFYIYLKAKYSHGIAEIISSKIISFFLKKNFFLKNKFTPSYLQYLTVNQSYEICSSTLMGIIEIISSVFIISGIFFFLLKINPTVFISIIVCIAILYFLIIFFLYGLLKKTSKGKFNSTKQITKSALEIYENLKEIKLLNLQIFFEKKFQDDYKIFNKYRIISKIIGRYPRLVVETSLIFIIVGGLNYFVQLNMDIVVSTTAIFVLGFYRILPYADTIFLSWSNFKISENLLDFLTKNKLLDNYDNKFNKKNEKIINFNSIEIKKASYQVQNKKLFKNFNLKINKKDKILISGSSGSGKTSLINIICGLYKFDDGSYRINSKDISKISNLNSIFSICSQNPILLNRSIKENITLNKKFDEKAFNHVCNIVKLSKILKKGKSFNTKINPDSLNFSGGEKQRISIARALYHIKPILIMDEATNGLDEKSEQEIIKKILRIYKDKTILFISHNHRLGKNFNKILSLD